MQASDWLARIHADPHDLGLRQVYGDLLLESGDVRGEFIQLQCADQRDAEQTMRMKGLLHAHLRPWLGALANVVVMTTVVFESGFLTECTLRDRPLRLSRLVGHPEWSTVRSLTLTHRNHSPRDRGFDIVVHPVMRALRVLRGIMSPEELEQLCEGDVARPISTLAMGYTTQRDECRRLLTAARQLPDLVRLELADDAWGRRPEDYRWLWKGELGARLDSLLVRDHLRELHAWVTELEDVPVRTVELAANRWRVRLTRGGDGAVRAVHAAYDPHQQLRDENPMRTLANVLSGLDANKIRVVTVRAVGLEASPRDIRRLRRTCPTPLDLPRGW